MIAQLRPPVPPPAGPGAIVPHAGWVYSGETAALGISAVGAWGPEVIVIFGAAHGPDRNAASLFGSGAWRTPLGELEVDEKIASQLERCVDITACEEAHFGEHSIEVQLPIIQYLMPEVRIVPISVPPGPHAAAVGQFCGRVAKESTGRVAFLGSTDLTHYGPVFGFEPHGQGEVGIRWAKEVNDRRFVNLVRSCAAEAVVAEAATHHNACGAGAVAATIAAMRELGATRYEELRHTCSAEAKGLGEVDPLNSVGYEAGVFLYPE
jgi:AmmeMemoRadiSam system protein B